MSESSSTISQPKVDSLMQFADRVGLQKAASDGKNFVFSPLSIRCALSLVAAGSKGPTLDQFLSFLGFRTLDDLNSATENLMASVRTTWPNRKPNPVVRRGESGPHVPLRDDPNPYNHGQHGSLASYSWDYGYGCQLFLANSIWIDQMFTLKPAFKQIATSIYHSEARTVDFKTLEAAKDVNTWVESQTNGLIKEIVPLDDWIKFTVVALVNAVYFTGRWLYEFDTKNTRDKEFHLLNGTSKRVPFMHIASDFREDIKQFDGFKVLELPYIWSDARRKCSMLIFLPDERDGLNHLIQKAVSDSNFFSCYNPSASFKVGKLRIPKFKISSGFEPSDDLPKMGLDIPFDVSRADLTELVFPQNPNFKLSITKVIHKATIEVGEKGTEAPAECPWNCYGMCLSRGYEAPAIDFVADHPFMFAIRAEESGSVLFLGHVVDPSAWGTDTKF